MATGTRREILRLAVPAFLALVAEPLFLLADSAVVGHLGVAQLAGLGVASSVLLTAAGVFVFLAYGTTSVVARHLGAGSPRDAVAAGLDGLWLSIVLGAVAAVAVAVPAVWWAGRFGAGAAAVDQAATYLRVAALGLPGMLVVLAVTGVLRGLQDTRTPLVTSVVGFTGNIALNVLFVYGLGWGIAGSAWGTVLAQTGMAVALVTVVLRAARRLGAPMRPHPYGVLRAAVGGVPLLVRTLALRAATLVTTAVAARYGDDALAAHQVVLTVWSFLAFALDALAIAAQAMTGRSLGAGDVDGARSVATTVARWGVVSGVVTGVVVLAVAPVAGRAFSSDPRGRGRGHRGVRRRRRLAVAQRLRLRRRRRAHGGRGHGVAGRGDGRGARRVGPPRAAAVPLGGGAAGRVRARARGAVGVVRRRVHGAARGRAGVAAARRRVGGDGGAAVRPPGR